MHKRSQLEHKSFKAYVSILYADPKMQIYIQNEKVRTKLLDYSLYRTLRYTYCSKIFKDASIKEREQAEKELSLAKTKYNEINSAYL
jgi:hypothetical protein